MDTHKRRELEEHFITYQAMNTTITLKYKQWQLIRIIIAN